MKHIAPLLLASALVLAARPAAAADPFYDSLLRQGVQQYDREEFADSAQTLRLACFGLLDEPLILGGCLSRLALAQDRAGDADGFEDTFRRLAEVEERFQGYSRAELPAEVRAALEQRLAARIPASTLRSIPAFRALADRTEAAGKAGKDAAARPSGQPSGGEPKPRSSEERKPVAAPPANPPAAAVEIAAVSPAPARPSSLTEAERGKMSQARRLLTAEGKIKELRQAFDLAREVADAHADSAEAQHLAAEAAYRISRWKEAAEYFKRGGEPGADQPELLFYMAVSLYESGEAQAAATVLRRSLPNLQRTPYVDAYARKILG